MFKWLRKKFPEWRQKYFPPKIKSGTEEYEKPIDVYEYLITRLSDLGRFDKIWFRSKQSKEQIQIKKYVRGGILIGVQFPFKVSWGAQPDDVFLPRGIKIPENWGLCARRRLRNILIFRTHKYNIEDMAHLFDEIYIKVFGCPDNYQVIGKIDLGIWKVEGTNYLFET